jgi:hypothetical protein
LENGEKHWGDLKCPRTKCGGKHLDLRKIEKEENRESYIINNLILD